MNWRVRRFSCIIVLGLNVGFANLIELFDDYNYNYCNTVSVLLRFGMWNKDVDVGIVEEVHSLCLAGHTLWLEFRPFNC